MKNSMMRRRNITYPWTHWVLTGFLCLFFYIMGTHMSPGPSDDPVSAAVQAGTRPREALPEEKLASLGLSKWWTTPSLTKLERSAWEERPQVKLLRSTLEEFWDKDVPSRSKDLSPAASKVLVSGKHKMEESLDLAFLAHATNAAAIVETGMAIASSTVALLGSLYTRDESDTFVDSLTVHSIDPFQKGGFGGAGLDHIELALEKFGQTFEGYKVREPSHVFHLNYASVSMGELYDSSYSADFIFMDDGHKYDDNIVELYFATKMLRQGGFLVIDDAWMPSVVATLEYATSNLPFVQIHGLYKRGVVLLKTGDDHRVWDFHERFCTPENVGKF